MSSDDIRCFLDSCYEFQNHGVCAARSGIAMLAMVYKDVEPPAYFNNHLYERKPETFRENLSRLIAKKYGTMIEAGMEMVNLSDNRSIIDFRPRVKPIEAYASVFFSHPMHCLINEYYDRGENDKAMAFAITENAKIIVDRPEEMASSSYVEHAFDYYIDTIAQDIGERAQGAKEWYDLTQIHCGHLLNAMQAYEDFRKSAKPTLSRFIS